MINNTTRLTGRFSAFFSQIKKSPNNVAQLFKKMAKIKPNENTLPKAKDVGNNHQQEHSSHPCASSNVAGLVERVSAQQGPIVSTLEFIQLSTPLPERRFDLVGLLGLNPTSSRTEYPLLSEPVIKLAEQLKDALKDFERSKTTSAPATKNINQDLMAELAHKLAQKKPEAFNQNRVKLQQPKSIKTTNGLVTKNVNQDLMAELTQKLAQKKPQALNQHRVRPESLLSESQPVLTNNNAGALQPTPSASLPPQSQPAVKTQHPKLERTNSEPAITNPQHAMLTELNRVLAQRTQSEVTKPFTPFHRTKSEPNMEIQGSNDTSVSAKNDTTNSSPLRAGKKHNAKHPPELQLSELENAFRKFNKKAN